MNARIAKNMSDKITELDIKVLSDILEKWDALSMCELKPDADGYTAGLNFGSDHCHDIRDYGRGLVEKLKRMNPPR